MRGIDGPQTRFGEPAAKRIVPKAQGIDPDRSLVGQCPTLVLVRDRDLRHR